MNSSSRRARATRPLALAAAAAAAAAAAVGAARSVAFARAGVSSQYSPALQQHRGVGRAGLSQPLPSVIQRHAGTPDGAQRPSGLAAAAAHVAATAAACALVVSAAARAAGQQRLSGIMMRMYPSRGNKKQKVMRRLEKFGPMPAWSRKPLVKKRLITPWFKRGPPHSKPVSDWGRRLWEKQRLRFHYNIKEFQLCRIMRKGFETSQYPIVRAMQILESRIDNVLWRTGLAPTMSGARYLINGQHVQLRQALRKDREDGWRTVISGCYEMSVGDQIRIRDREYSLRTAKGNLELDEVRIPENLDFDKENLIVNYTGICDPAEFGIQIEEKMVFMWYVGQGTKKQKALRRTHIRYFPGTKRVIDRKYRGGKPRPTPENRLNMKLGRGLNPQGRRRPPSLWGRRTPLNNPYQVNLYKRNKA